MADRNLEKQSYAENPLFKWPQHAGVPETVLNTVALTLSRYMPLRMKNKLLRVLGIEIGENTAVGLDVQFDIFHPENISIGKNSTIGYGTTILTHETTQDEFREGDVKIGDNVLIGANTTVLPGVEIGDNATVSAHSLVNRDVPQGKKYGGVPVEELGKTREE